MSGIEISAGHWSNVGALVEAGTAIRLVFEDIDNDGGRLEDATDEQRANLIEAEERLRGALEPFRRDFPGRSEG